jgi:hypothetical protein
VETSSPPEVANMIKGIPEPLSLQLHRATQEQLAIGWNFVLRRAILECNMGFVPESRTSEILQKGYMITMVKSRDPGNLGYF